MTSKWHVAVDTLGRPIRFLLTGGQAAANALPLIAAPKLLMILVIQAACHRRDLVHLHPGARLGRRGPHSVRRGSKDQRVGVQVPPPVPSFDNVDSIT